MCFLIEDNDFLNKCNTFSEKVFENLWLKNNLIANISTKKFFEFQNKISWWWSYRFWKQINSWGRLLSYLFSSNKLGVFSQEGWKLLPRRVEVHWKKVIGHIIDFLESLSNNSDVKQIKPKHQDNGFLREQFWKCLF